MLASMAEREHLRSRFFRLQRYNVFPALYFHKLRHNFHFLHKSHFYVENNVYLCAVELRELAHARQKARFLRSLNRNFVSHEGRFSIFNRLLWDEFL